MECPAAASTSRDLFTETLFLLCRWDCASEEEEYLIHAVYDQHIKRTSDFLTSELKVAEDADEAGKRIFFVSAKEAMLISSPENVLCLSPLKSKRSMEWDR